MLSVAVKVTNVCPGVVDPVAGSGRGARGSQLLGRMGTSVPVRSDPELSHPLVMMGCVKLAAWARGNGVSRRQLARLVSETTAAGWARPRP